MKEDCIYLMVEDGPKGRIKIGFSNDPIGRSLQLSAKIDQEKSIFIYVDQDQVKLIEKLLHRMFRKYNARMETNRASQNGETEWFENRCFGLAKTFIDKNSKLFVARKWKTFLAANGERITSCR